MFKILAIKPANVIRTTLAVLLLINVHAVSAQEKPALNRSTLLSNKIELPSKKIDTKVIRVTIPPAFKTTACLISFPSRRSREVGLWRQLNREAPNSVP